MFPIRKLIRKSSRHYSLRKKISWKKTSNDKKIYKEPEAVTQQNDPLNSITLLPSRLK